MVAASRPGDLAYGVRVAVERAPALLARGSESRARAELGIAARRLADLDRTMSSQEQALDERTVAALLASVEQAADLAASLPEAVRGTSWPAASLTRPAGSRAWANRRRAKGMRLRSASPRGKPGTQPKTPG